MRVDARERPPTLGIIHGTLSRFMPSAYKLVLLASFLGLTPLAAETAGLRPWETGAFDLETGVLWQIGTLTPLSYRLVPTQLSWRSRQFLGRVFADGSRLLVRHRLTLIGTWVQDGPESHYVGFSASPSVEWWDKTGTWSLFTGAGGGGGVIDSRGVAGGQGQDFTLNWFIRGGVEHVTAKDRRFSIGIMYQHLSNGGQTEPNPGIDALGFTIGYSRAF
jgi:lipid A 3-O-deacylase